MKCHNCEYEWATRVVNPKSCPECKTRLNRVRKRAKDVTQPNDSAVGRVASQVTNSATVEPAERSDLAQSPERRSEE